MPALSISISDAAYTALKTMEEKSGKKRPELLSNAILDYSKKILEETKQ